MKKGVLTVLSVLVLGLGNIYSQESSSKIQSKIQNYLEELTKQNQFSGTVLVAKDENILFKKAYGLASREWQISNKIDTKFNLGSMNKMFTAVAIAQLQERGKLSFEDKVIALIPNYPNEAVANKVTVKHLLTHTSGMGSYFNKKYVESSKNNYRQVNDYDSLYINDPLSFEPGARFQYSNSGFMLLGKIIESVSGENYFDFIRKNVYKPANMNNSDSYELDLIISNLAAGYTRGSIGGSITDGKLRNNIFMHVLKGGPAGGGYSTVEDLLKFANALTGGKLISKNSLSTLTTKYNSNNYGHGFTVNEIYGLSSFGHSGGFPGINSQLRIFPSNGYKVSVMSNIDGGATPVVNRISQIIAGHTPPKLINMSSAELQNYAGSYAIQGNNNIKVEVKDNGLLLNGRIVLIPYGKGKFFDKNLDHLRFFFEINDKNEVESIEMKTGPQGAWKARKIVN